MFSSLVPLGDPMTFRIKYEKFTAVLAQVRAQGGETLSPPPLPEYAPVYVKYILHA